MKQFQRIKTEKKQTNKQKQKLKTTECIINKKHVSVIEDVSK